MILGFLCLTIMGIISPGFILYKHIGVLRGGRETSQDIIASNGMRLIGVIFIFLQLLFLASALINIKSMHSVIKYTDKNECTDPTTQRIWDYLGTVLDDVFVMDRIALIVVSVMGLLELISIISLFILSCKV